MKGSFWCGVAFHGSTKWDGCSLVVECETRNWKVVGSVHSKRGRRIFFPRADIRLFVLSLISASIPPLRYRNSTNTKGPGHCAASAGGQLQLKTHTPWTDKVRAERLHCPSTVGEPFRETSSLTPGQEMPVHSHLSSRSHCGLIVG